MTRKREPRGSQVSSPRATGIPIALLVALAVPRIVRMLYPEIWVEDDFYAESAWLVSQGMRPYLDFVHPHLPLLEWVAAGYLKLFGASHISIEILNEAAIYVTSVLTFVLAQRVASRPTAILAATMYAFSSLTFRYHLYERECFVAPLAVWGALVALDDDIDEMRQALMLAAIFLAACAIKLTAAIPFGVILVFIATVRRRLVGAIVSGVGFIAALAILSALLYWRYGFAFIFQVYAFHFLKGRDTTGSVAWFPTMIFDVLAPFFILGCARVIAERLYTRALAIVLAIVAAAYLFFGVLSPTAWGHNYLEPLPFIAIIASLGLKLMLDSVRQLITAEEVTRSRLAWVIGGGLLIAICLFWLTPIQNENWLHGSAYGFGFIPREEIDRLGDAVRKASGPDDDVIAPSFVCFQANRRELIRFPETYGVYREGLAALQSEGFAAARQQLGRADFFHLIESTMHYWTDEMKAAIESGKVNVVVNDSPVQLLPLVLVPDELLVKNGFQPVTETEHFIVWQRATSGNHK